MTERDDERSKDGHGSYFLLSNDIDQSGEVTYESSQLVQIPELPHRGVRARSNDIKRLCSIFLLCSLVWESSWPSWVQDFWWVSPTSIQATWSPMSLQEAKLDIQYVLLVQSRLFVTDHSSYCLLCCYPHWVDISCRWTDIASISSVVILLWLYTVLATCCTSWRCYWNAFGSSLSGKIS